VVVLDEDIVDPELREHVLAIALVEEPADIPVDDGFDPDEALQARLEAAHGAAG
jgi:hypothetical protein